MSPISVYLFVNLLLMVAITGQVLAYHVEDPLCANKACSAGTVCRVVAENGALNAICLDANEFEDYRCRIGKTILTRMDFGFVDLTCYPERPCPESTFCDTSLMDTYSACCRSDPTSPVNPGECPNYQVTEFCVDLCLNDGDCTPNYKCCQVGCRKQCTRPL